MSEEVSNEVKIDEVAEAEERKLQAVVSVLEEKLSRQLEISLDELRKKKIVITNSKITVK